MNRRERFYSAYTDIERSMELEIIRGKRCLSHSELKDYFEQET